MNYSVLAIIIFIITYAIIISEKINRMVIALFSATLVILLNILSQDEALNFIDANTLILLISMMIIVNILKRTGIFEFLSIKIAKISKGNPTKILIMFSLFTGISSAFLDNVTTILLVAPVTIVITKVLDISPIPFILSEVMIANIAGTATLIGDPPNIMIGSKTSLTFMDFLKNLSPVIIIITILTLFLFKFIFKNSLITSDDKVNEIYSMNENLMIKDITLLKKSSIILILTIIGFLLSHNLHLKESFIALIGASTLMLISNIEPEEIINEIEWSTIFFFTALFILVGSLEKVGIISLMANKLIEITNGNLFLTAMAILWGSAIASAFLDNIPFVTTMIPLIISISNSMPNIDITPLWWALSLGACLGGNGTIIGASANVIACGILEKRGIKIKFSYFFKIGMPVMLISILISSIYIKLRYF